MSRVKPTSESDLDICLLKKRMRNQIFQAKEAISNEEMLGQASQLCSQLERTDIWSKSKIVLLYSNLSKEISVNQLIEKGLKSKKVIALPRYDSESRNYTACIIRGLKDLVIGRYGVMEPLINCPEINMNQLDLVIVPGVAFDRIGGRLGRGGGYYDQILKKLAAISCGVCFREQVVHQTPQELHDVKMDFTMTPDGKLDFNLI
jgi:5-formyltetrahydrofolate cyclo-ligase